MDVADNTGAKRAAAIGVIGRNQRYAFIGDVIKAHIKEATPDGTVTTTEPPPAAGTVADPASVIRAVVADVPDEWLTPVPGTETRGGLREAYVAFLSARLASRTWLPRASAA